MLFVSLKLDKMNQENDLINIRMFCKGLTHHSPSSDDVKDSCGQSGFCADLCKEQGGQAGVRGRLQHHCVPGRQGRCDLPGEEHQRKVPGNNCSNNSH
jgi:hypothetical protein